MTHTTSRDVDDIVLDQAASLLADLAAQLRGSSIDHATGQRRYGPTYTALYAPPASGHDEVYLDGTGTADDVHTAYRAAGGTRPRGDFDIEQSWRTGEHPIIDGRPAQDALDAYDDLALLDDTDPRRSEDAPGWPVVKLRASGVVIEPTPSGHVDLVAPRQGTRRPGGEDAALVWDWIWPGEPTRLRRLAVAAAAEVALTQAEAARRAAVTGLIDAGMTVAAVARHYGVTRKTIYAWTKQKDA